ncbi:MAG: hypothetical protein JWN30_1509 [Bacilli bacterium]|nr:hypothetical protein [Bacilli bacterium]
MLNKQAGIVLAILLLCLFAIGCSSGAQAVPNVNEPITLTVFNGQPGAFDFDKLGVTDALKAKFPNITFKIINKTQGMDYPDLVAAGNLPDIIYESASFTVDRIMKYGFQYDLQDLATKNNFNLAQFEPNVLAQTRSANSEGKLYGFPFTMNRYALFYNKDIFDKFGLPYPKDGMTWDDVYDTAKKVTGQVGGVTYQGFTATPNNTMLNNQLSLSALDPKQDKATVNTDGWKELYQNLRRFFEIPNNQLLPTSDASKGGIAMVIDSNPNILTWAKANPSLNWDIVSVPALKELPKTGFKPAALDLFVSQSSTYKDQAFQVISYLVSNDIQTMISKKGIGTPLASNTVKQAFGQDIPEMKGKNINAFYYYHDAPPSPPRASNLTNVNVDFGIPFVNMLQNNTDTNTVLSQFDDQINKDIATAKNQK